jgi:hypothetical protein
MRRVGLVTAILVMAAIGAGAALATNARSADGWEYGLLMWSGQDNKSMWYWATANGEYSGGDRWALLRDMGLHYSDSVSVGMLEFLNEVGRDGWELIEAREYDVAQPELRFLRWYFKRPLVD